MSDLSTRVRLRREQLGLSQEELARRMGYRSRSSITKLEKGINDLPQSKVEELAQALGEALGANVIQVIGGMIVLQRPIDEEKVRAKKAARAGDKKVKKKKVHIKGMRQRQREKEEKNPYAKYDRPKYYGR